MSNLCENCKCNSETEVCADCDWRTKRYKIPKFATNGDVIKAMFKIDHINDYSQEIELAISVGRQLQKIMEIDRVWWNAPYKAEREVEE